MNSDGRVPRCGLERSAYDKLFTQEGTVATRYPIRDNPESFDQEATPDDKRMLRTCYQRRTGLCRSNHAGIYDKCRTFSLSFARFLQARRLDKPAFQTLCHWQVVEAAGGEGHAHFPCDLEPAVPPVSPADAEDNLAYAHGVSAEASAS